MKKLSVILHFLVSINFATSQSIVPSMNTQQIKSVEKHIYKRLGKYPLMFTHWQNESERKVMLSKVVITPSQNRIHLYFNEPLGQVSIREELIRKWEQMVRDTLGKNYATSRVQLYCYQTPVERLVPNVYRSRFAKDLQRQGDADGGVPMVRNIDRPLFPKGLFNKHIAVWASHGRYYDDTEKAWTWQRPPLFGSNEDLNSFEYVYRYLIPMLENAGAIIISPRERDPNPREIIVDENRATILSGHWKVEESGFAQIDTLRNENPFAHGKHLRTRSGGSVEYLLNAPRDEYAIYVSYKSLPAASSSVKYEVTHSGGTTYYLVNQQMGSGWLYLGTHVFDAKSKVVIHAKDAATTDAVRLGGGMGNVERCGTISGVPRWAEGARYFLQYSGVPASIYAQDTEEKGEPKDYWDDYKCRGDWTTWIKNEKNVPIDAAVTLHTNAGILDTIFGTLTINSTEKHKGKYSDGKSKLAGRDMADIVMTQIVSDLRAKHNSQWSRRSMYDKAYRETLSPDSPSIIIELLSHQNLNDMVYALDPKFRFDACRAIYKGILRFLADRYSQSYVIQPLPPTHFAMKVEGSKLVMSWIAHPDELEPTAMPTHYRLYTRMGEGGFDNGVNVYESRIELPLVRDGEVCSYKITALNDGGESFPTEILSACFLPSGPKLAIIVNEFNTLSGPAKIEGGLDFSTFVPYKHDLGIVGHQINFDPESEFVDNANPGWGKSTLNLATKGVAGNTFDYTVKMGWVVTSEGFSYISTSLDGYDPQKRYDKVFKITSRIP